MDALAPTLRNVTWPEMPPGQIDGGAPGIRRTAATAEQQEGLRASIRALGVLQPIIVRSHPTQPQIRRVVAGRRRLAAALELGLPAVPVDDRGDISDAEAAAIEMAENTARTALAPIDQWRAIAQLRALGWTQIADIADALGIPVPLARRMQKIGDLHPDLLAAVEQHGMPARNDWFHAVAGAPRATQEAAITAHWKHRTSPPDWYSLARACADTWIPASRAVFDVQASGLVWDEDLFAEPDQALRTADAAGFVAAQRAALQAVCEASKGRVQLVALDKNHDPKLPKGYARAWGDGWRWGSDKPPGKGRTAFVAVAEDGRIVTAVATNPPAKKKPEKAAKPGKATPVPQAKTEEEHEEEADAPEPRNAPAAAPKHDLTHRGREMLGALKTDALRATLRDRGHIDEDDVMYVLLLALAGRNVTVLDDTGSRIDMGDVAAVAFALRRDLATRDRVAFGGRLARLAREAAARMLRCGPHPKPMHASGPVAEHAGAALHADGAMPRLDTEEVLQQLSLDALRRIGVATLDATAARATATQLRARLAGHHPDLARDLPGARFAAPPLVLDAPEEAATGERPCGQQDGATSCSCGWRKADGKDAEDCARALWHAELGRLGLTRDQVVIDAEEGALLIAPLAPPPPSGPDMGNPMSAAAAPADHDEQRRRDAAAFDCPVIGGFDCAWSGTSPCREDGTTRCGTCPRHARYVEWLATPAGRRAKRAQENAEARASLKRARKKGTTT